MVLRLNKKIKLKENYRKNSYYEAQAPSAYNRLKIDDS